MIFQLFQTAAFLFTHRLLEASGNAKSRSCTSYFLPLDGAVHLCHFCFTASFKILLSTVRDRPHPLLWHRWWRRLFSVVQRTIRWRFFFFFSNLLGWFWHLCLNRRCEVWLSAGGRGGRVMAQKWRNSWKHNEGMMLCSVLTPQWLCCFLCS